MEEIEAEGLSRESLADRFQRKSCAADSEHGVEVCAAGRRV